MSTPIQIILILPEAPDAASNKPGASLTATAEEWSVAPEPAAARRRGAPRLGRRAA
jgi:hypothetical protein